MSALSSWLQTLPAGFLATVSTWLAVLLTLAVLSRLLGENIFSRLAQYLFVGVAAGYAVGLAWLHVLWPRLQLLLSDPLGQWPIALFMALGVLLLLRVIKPSSPLGDAPVSVMLGVGAGLALVGAGRGTLAPQISSAISGPATNGSNNWLAITTLITMSLATVLTLAAFHHQRRTSGLAGGLDRVVQALGAVGRRLIMLALGAVLAGAWLAFFAALQGRVEFIAQAIQRLIATLGL